MTGLEYILISTIVFYTLVLMVILLKVFQLSKQVTAQVLVLQSGVQDNLRRLQSRTEPLLEDAHQKMQLLQTRGEPILEETQKLLASARPVLEQLAEVLASAKPIMIDAHATVLMAKESAAIAKSVATTLKIEAESCAAAITTTTTELTKITQEEAENLRQFVVETRERTSQQLMRVDQLVSRTTDRIDHTAHTVETGVLKPVSEIAAVLSALQRFVAVLLAPTERKQVDEAYQDEEMFI